MDKQKEIIFKKVICPKCRSNAKVRIYDSGLKLLVRWFSGNNRYFCMNCSITWRKKEPYYWQEIRERH